MGISNCRQWVILVVVGRAPPADGTPCPPTPTVPPPPPPHVDDWDLKRSTVQIRRDVPPDNPRMSLGTVVEDGSVIITHKHFNPGKAEKVVIYDYAMRDLVTFDDEDVIEKSEINEQTLRWQLKEQLEGKIHIAEIGGSFALRMVMLFLFLIGTDTVG
jgi:hypothetical protein